MTFPAPTGGASLILAFRAQQPVLVVGANQLAASRVFSALEADYPVVVLARGGLQSACQEIVWRAEQGQITFVDLDAQHPPSPTNAPPTPSTSAASDRDLEAFAAYLQSIDGASLVCVTDTVLGDQTAARRPRASATQLWQLCRARNLPVNVTDMPDLCDFTFASTHRFVDPHTEQKSPLQVAVVTNGQGCRLSSRVRREIVAKLPRDVGAAVSRVGTLRRLAKESSVDVAAEESWIDEDNAPTPNRPVPQRSATETAFESVRRRMKWVAQVSEYWPYSRLAAMAQEDMDHVLNGDGLGLTLDASAPQRPQNPDDHPGDSEINSLHALSLLPAPTPPHGRIYLLGSGPGHPGLLTMATHTVLTKRADLVLSDKLVPEAVLALIPPGVEVRIARKFPGNADGAQQEMMEAAVDAAKRGLTVVRLKQGDPTVYGRAGEEVLYFRQHGFEAILIPGVSSALAGPVFAGIPVTQRGAAESFVVCTGVGRQGKEVTLPGYDRPRTLVVLMGVARLAQVLETLMGQTPRRDGSAYPAHTPIAIIERASMPDQRVIVSTLAHVATALASSGEQRPPGMIVVGWAVLSLWGSGDVGVLEPGAEGQDLARVERWLGGEHWRVVEGVDPGWDALSVL
ncbi:uroporphyrin-III C-methyltransferase [Amylostereum chailletii]|nr:uroporphyrin-III C-methyltransferase [Amylostereum chailletii]